MTDIRDEWMAMGERLAEPYERPQNAQFWAPQFECMSRAQLRKLQIERASVAYRYLWQKSGYYRAKFEGAGLGPDAIRSYEDLLKVPVTHRNDWLEDQRAHPPWGTFSPLAHEDWLSSGWLLFATSGTTANAPRAFRHTKYDQRMWAWQASRALHAMGIGKGDLAFNCFGYGPSVAFWGLHYGLTHMGVPLIPGGGSNSERRISLIRQFSPTVLLCTPSYALYLGRVAQGMGVDPAALSIKKLVVAGEPGASIPSTKKRIEEMWGAKVFDDFGCTEVAMSPMGYTCQYQANREDGVDPHLMEDVYLVESLDPQTWQPVAPGKPGVLVVSNLYSESQPILRYVVGDWITISEDPCPCGRTHARAVGGLRGRNDHLIKLRGLLFFPAVIEDAVRSLRDMGDEFRVDIVRNRDMDYIQVTLEPSPDQQTSPHNDYVAKRLKGTLGVDVDVKFVPYGTLPRSEFKANRIFDHRGAHEA